MTYPSHRRTVRVDAVPYIPTPFWLRALRALGYISLGILMYAIIIVCVFEFMVGCGERTYYPDGTWETNECLFIPYEPVSGRW